MIEDIKFIAKIYIAPISLSDVSYGLKETLDEEKEANADIYVHGLCFIHVCIIVGRDGALVESTHFVRKVMGIYSRFSRYVGTLGKSFTHSCLWRSGVKFRNSIHAVSGAPLSGKGLEEAL